MIITPREMPPERGTTKQRWATPSRGHRERGGERRGEAGRGRERQRGAERGRERQIDAERGRERQREAEREAKRGRERQREATREATREAYMMIMARLERCPSAGLGLLPIEVPPCAASP